MISMATPLAEPYGRPRDYVWRMAGLGRPVLWSMAAATAVSAVAAVAASAWALYETRTADDRVQRWVVWVDGTAAPIGRVPIGQDWSPSPGAYVDFAERWIRNLRSRPTDLDTLKLNRRDVIWTTDQRVYGPLQESMKKADEEFRNTAVDVARLAATLDDQQANRAVVHARWTEQPRGAAPPTAWQATLTVTYAEPKARAEFERNPVGLYVTNFQITQEGK
jgi:type IV secretory pathway TrbF-like protein